MTDSPVVRIEPERSVLLVVDVQARLAPHVLGAQGIERRCVALVKGAQELDVPVFLTEHCPEALGPTLSFSKGPRTHGPLLPVRQRIALSARHRTALD